MEATPPQRRKVPGPVTAEWLFRAGMHYLERYASSTENLRSVLRRKLMRRCLARGEDAEAFAPLVEEAMGRFADLKLIDDRAYAEARAASLRRRGTSHRQASAKLLAKGVEPDLVAAALAVEGGDERASAWRYAERRRLGPFRLRDRAERRDRDVAAMIRAGFAFADAAAVIDGNADERSCS
ncbi:regulatory protein RecX [Mangrovicella endophytica]|uniref:regulatory protein RecX n=1 Tax=Mangrovicella endophytica TaxID=2066697 RepID=UPI000C9EA8E5|nr:RecX family transcriptional regulator [Mangrovicella endophytica]